MKKKKFHRPLKWEKKYFQRNIAENIIYVKKFQTNLLALMLNICSWACYILAEPIGCICV